MAFKAMTPQAALLAGAGVRHVLTGGVVPAAYSLCPDALTRGTALSAPSGTAMATGGPTPGGDWGAQPRGRQACPGQTPGQPRGLTPHPAPQAPARTDRQPSGQPRSQARVPAPRQQSPLTAARTAPRRPLDEWAPAWRALLEKTHKGPLCWTYWELGYDLSGQADATRRQCLTRLIRDLALPRGTHTFWPPALPGETGALEADLGTFWTGLRVTGSRTLVVMGSRAARAIGITETIQPHTLLTKYGTRVLVTRDLSYIADEKRYEMTLTFLRTALSVFTR